MFYTLAELAERYPAIKRYAEGPFELVRPVLSLELEFDIQSVNQTLRVNAEGTDVRSMQAFQG